MYQYLCLIFKKIKLVKNNQTGENIGQKNLSVQSCNYSIHHREIKIKSYSLKLL